MADDGGVWAKVYPNAMVLGNGRNLLYNGAMQVAQRGTSATGITTGAYYTADRWFTGTSGFPGTWTQSIEVDAPFASAGLAKSLKLLCTTADAAPAAKDSFSVTQALEGQDLQHIRKGSSSAEQLTLSFWVKSNVTGTYIAELNDSDNSLRVSAAYTISASATWEKKTITFPADTTGGLDNDNNGSLNVRFWLLSGSDFTSGSLATTWHNTAANRAVGQTNLAASVGNYWQVTGVQLETGAVATPFEFKSYGQELAECQRYYFRTGKGTFALSGFCISTTVANVAAALPTTMRVNPTALEQTGTAGDYIIRNRSGNVTCTGVPAFLYASTNGVAITLTATGLTQGDGVIGYTGGIGYLAWSAEL